MENSLEQQKIPVKNSNKVNEPFIGDILGGSKNPAKDLLSNVRPLLKESKDEIDGILDDLIEGHPEPGSQKNRFSSEPEGFFNSTKIKIEENNNASVKLFLETSIRKKTKKLMSER